MESPIQMYKMLKAIYYYSQQMKRTRYINNLIRHGLCLGEHVDIIDTFFFDPSHCFLISIGDNCTICPNVRLIAHDASTKKYLGYTKIGRIDIRENCFIGDSAVVLPGVSIGPNTIIGAGSIVTHDIPPNVVAAGNPARELFPLELYLEKIEKIAAEKTVFTQDYYIENLDDTKSKEIIQSIGDSIGFIV